MTTEVVDLPLTISAATRDVQEAWAAVVRHQSSYARLRHGMDRPAMTRSRTDLRLAILEWIYACVTLAEAEDRLDPAWAAAEESLFKIAGPSHDQCNRSWIDYQEARKAGDQAAIAMARVAWRDTLTSWLHELGNRWTIEDNKHVEEARHAMDLSQRVHPGDAFPSLPGRQADELVQTSRERERQEAARKSNMRDSTGLDGWRPVYW
jgi:hypothetical protein